MAVLLDWILLGSHLCAVRLRGSFKESFHCFSWPLGLFSYGWQSKFNIVLFYKLRNVLLKTGRDDIVISARNMNAGVGLLSSNRMHLRNPSSLHSYLLKMEETVSCLNYYLPCANTNSRSSNRQWVTWSPLVSSRRWNQMDHITISQSCQMLACIRLFICYSGLCKLTL